MRKLIATVAGACVAAAVAAAPAVATPGEITYIDHIADGEGGAKLNEAGAVVVAPNNRFVFATADLEDTLTSFRRSRINGTLSIADTATDGVDLVLGLDNVNDVTTAPGSNHIYTVAGGVDDALMGFEFDPVSGQLTAIDQVFNGTEGVTDMESPQQVEVSPDGRNVYVTSFGDNAIVWFDRDLETGELTFNQRIGFVGDVEPRGMAITPDGETIAIAMSGTDIVSNHSRNPVTGDLAFENAVNDGGDGGLDGASRLAFDPLGRFLYVTAGTSGAVGILELDPVTRALSYVDELDDSEPGGSTLGGPIGLDIYRGHVYVASGNGGPNAGAVNAFRRSGGTGALTFINAALDDLLSAGIGRVADVAVAPDGAHVYTAAGDVSGTDDDAVAAFRREARLNVRVIAPRRQFVDSLRARLTCSGPCSFTARVRGRAGGNPFTTEPVSMTIPAQSRKLVEFELSPTQIDELEGLPGRARIIVDATDDLGQSDRAVKRIRLKP